MKNVDKDLEVRGKENHTVCAVSFTLLLLFSHCVLSDSFVTPSTVPHKFPLSMGFFRQEYWRGLQFPTLGDHLDPGIEPGSAALQADSLPLSHQGSLCSHCQLLVVDDADWMSPFPGSCSLPWFVCHTFGMLLPEASCNSLHPAHSTEP